MDLKDAQKRWNDSIQLCKLIAACFVVFIHVMLPGAIGGVAEAAARFAVPFFFAVSGYFSFRLSSSQIKKRLLAILRLLVIATLVCLVADLIVLKIQSGDTLADYFSAVFSEGALRDWLIFGTNPISEHLWYLNAALGCYLIFWMYTRWLFGKYAYRLLYPAAFALLILQFILGSFLPLLGVRFSYQVCRNTALLGLPMFVLGLFIREHQSTLAADHRFSQSKLSLYICLGTVCSVVWRILFYETELPFGAVIAAGALMALTAINPALFSFKSNQRKFSEACGRISMVIYIIHPSVNHLLASLIDLSAYLQPFVVIAVSLLFGALYDAVMRMLSNPHRTPKPSH